MLVVPRVFGAKRTNLHEKYDDPSAHAAWLPIPAIGFASLFVVQAIVTSRPDSALARRLHSWCYGGLYLDERLHRLVLRWMPLPATARPATTVQTL